MKQEQVPTQPNKEKESTYKTKYMTHSKLKELSAAINYKQQTKTKVMITIYQINTKGIKVPKLVANDLNSGLGMLYLGLNKQANIGKRFLTLAKGRPIFVEGMNKSGYLHTTNLVPANWTQAQCLEAISYLLRK